MKGLPASKKAGFLFKVVKFHELMSYLVAFRLFGLISAGCVCTGVQCCQPSIILQKMLRTSDLLTSDLKQKET